MQRRSFWNVVPMWALALMALALGLCGMGSLFGFVALTSDDSPPQARGPCEGLTTLPTVPLEVHDPAGGQIRIGDERDSFLGFARSGDRIVRLDGQVRRGPGMVDVKVCLTSGALAGKIGYISNQTVRAVR